MIGHGSDNNGSDWPCRRLRTVSGKLQGRPLNFGRLYGLPSWDEVQRQVRSTMWSFYIITVLLRDKDQDGGTDHWAKRRRGGGWWNNCCMHHLMGHLTNSSLRSSFDDPYIFWQHGGERGRSTNSWKEAKMVIIPK